MLVGGVSNLTVLQQQRTLGYVHRWAHRCGIHRPRVEVGRRAPHEPALMIRSDEGSELLYRPAQGLKIFDVGN